MAKLKDLTGQTFGKLTVIEIKERKPRKTQGFRTYWLCKCACGNYCTVESSHLTSGHTTSCGCYIREKRIEMNYTHKLAHTRLYKIYHGMKKRCYNKNCKNYKLYGARNINVCDEWLNDFKVFYDWAMCNGYNDTLSIDRIDPNGNYEPLNCRWCNSKEQQNNKTNNTKIEYKGKTQNIMSWCMELNLDYYTIAQRLNKLKWSIDKALSTPTTKGFKELER